MEESKTLVKKRGNFIFRQELTNLTPECNAKCAIFCNIVLMILFYTFGGIIVAYSNMVIEFSQDYSTCIADKNNTCHLVFNITANMTPPVFLYYGLDNFYMNHRDFVKSRNYPQLRGEINVDSTNNSMCSGAIYISEMFDNNSARYTNPWNHTFLPTDFANPCGLIAKSLFNDTYQIVDSNSTDIFINCTNISNDYDKSNMFLRNKNYTTLQWMDVTDEHFIVWMQMETFPNFRKLWGRIDQPINKGTYTINVKNNYNVQAFNGNKHVILSTSSPFGSSSFFGYALIIGGSYCLFIILVIVVLYSINKNKNFDYNSLKWK